MAAAKSIRTVVQMRRIGKLAMTALIMAPGSAGPDHRVIGAAAALRGN
jgi:hypothetical protein